MLPKYTSTRDCKVKISSKDAIIKGISKEGGLFVLNDIDKINIDIEPMLNYSYQEMAFNVFKMLLPDFNESEIKKCIDDAYFNSFDNNEITPLKNLNHLDILELFHGPTCAFKDIGLQMLPQLMKCALKTNFINKKVMILTATSGDTGKAALVGFKDVENIAISVFYPHNKVSNMQYQQMATQAGVNTNVCAIEGNFDDAQTAVKALFKDKQLNDILNSKQLYLSSANSINIGRLIPQVVYYFDAYAKMRKSNKIKKGEKVNFCVPTGNFGNILAGYYAKLMGLPINKLIVASNSNNVLYDFINKGFYNRQREFIKTISPSMDILISSNLERLLYYMCDKDTNVISKYMSDLESIGHYQLDLKVLAKIQETFVAGFATDLDCNTAIKECFKTNKYLIDPHTATGYVVAREYQKIDNEHRCILLSTASPYKFAPQVYNALTNTYINDEWECIEKLNTLTKMPVPKSILELKNLPILHNELINIEQMKDYIIKKSLKGEQND